MSDRMPQFVKPSPRHVRLVRPLISSSLGVRLEALLGFDNASGSWRYRNVRDW